jgi:acetylglutamate kinase
MYERLIRRARVVLEALPYLRKFHGKVIVVKYGGGAMTVGELREQVTTDLVLLKYVGMHPVLVHGGGPEINRVLQTKNIKSQYVEGLRVTDEVTLEVVEKVLGRINGRLVRLINQGGGKARGFTGRKGKIVRAKRLEIQRKGQRLDLARTGDVRSIDVEHLEKVVYGGYIPVISSVGVDGLGRTYNINADVVAGAVAGALGAAKLILLTGILGVLNKKGQLISEINASRARRYTRSGVIHGGMIPKVKCGLEALKKGVESVHIIDGRIPHAILLEIFTDTGIGTMVVP